MKVKVNRVRGGSMGDQRNYGLITGSIWNYEDKPSSNQVGTTMSAVPRDEATIEAERGETIVGDLDNDGMLEHAIVGGKRHFAGGTPLNVPDGSFVFSDTRALKINNKDVLKGIFNMGGTGITPAKVAKRYDLNQYKDLLMDPESDLLTKKTAQMMIDNNMKKLGQLALIQEGMKGFPDGVPNIAAPLFANDIAQPESSESRPMMRRGGLVKAQKGIQVNSSEYPLEMYKYWINKGPIQVNNPRSKSSVIKEYQPEPYESKALRFLKENVLPFGSFAGMVNPYSAMLNASTEPNAVKGYQFQTGGNKTQKAEDEGVPEWLKPYLVMGTASLTPEIISGLGSAASWVGKNIPWHKLKPPGWTMELWERLPDSAKMKEVLKSAPKQLKKPIPRVGLALGLAGLSDYLNWFGNDESEPETMPITLPTGAVNKISSSKFKTPAQPQPQVQPVNDVIEIDPVTNTINTTVPVASTSGSTSKPNVAAPAAMTDDEIRQIISDQMGLPIDSINDEYIKSYRKYNFKTGGEDLPIHQTKGRVKYDLYDKALRDAAKSAGKVYHRPWSYVDPNLPQIGPQTSTSGKYELTPEGVWWLKGQNNLNLDELKNYPVKWDDYNGGFDQWKKDIAAGKGKESPASKWWVNKVNEYAVNQTGVPIIDVNQKGAYIPGYEWSTPGIFAETVKGRAGQDEESQAPVADVTKLGSIPSPTYTGGYQAPWSNYSMVDNAAALANYFDIERGDLPIKQRYTPYLPDATYLDPARAIAQQQGTTRASQEAIMSGSQPTVGRANVIAAQAAAAPQIADIMSKYDQANVGIANQMESARAQILNEAELRNLGLDKQYMDEIATLNQQYQNALAAGRTEVAESVKRAMVDAMQRGALNVQNPNYAIGPNGQIYFKPGFNPATGTNIFAGTSGLGNIPALMKSYMTDYQLTGDQAAALIRAQLASRGRNSYGVNNPMDALWNSEV